MSKLLQFRFPIHIQFMKTNIDNLEFMDNMRIGPITGRFFLKTKHYCIMSNASDSRDWYVNEDMEVVSNHRHNLFMGLIRRIYISW